MSYDVYFWHRAEGDFGEVSDALAEQDLSCLVPHPSVRAFRQDLLARYPHLADVLGPAAGPGTDADLRYLELTLPYSWVPGLPGVIELATAHGLGGWDPQLGEPVGVPQERTPAGREAPVDVAPGAPWTVPRLSGIGIGSRSLARAWAIAGLPAEVGFGEAVGALILAMALRDGIQVGGAQARRIVAEVAGRCAHGVPTADWFVDIHDENGGISSMTDVTGFAGAVARGGF